MDAGLPVFAILNPGNELINIIEENKIGDYSTGLDVCELEVKLKELLLSLPKTNELKKRCSDLIKNLFSTNKIATEIVNSLMKK